MAIVFTFDRSHIFPRLIQENKGDEYSAGRGAGIYGERKAGAKSCLIRLKHRIRDDINTNCGAERPS